MKVREDDTNYTDDTNTNTVILLRGDQNTSILLIPQRFFLTHVETAFVEISEHEETSITLPADFG